MLNLWESVKKKKAKTVNALHSNKEKELIEEIEKLKKSKIINSKTLSRNNSPIKRP